MNNDPSRHMQYQPRWSALGLVPVIVGILWLVTGWPAGWLPGLIASVPGVVLTGAGAALLLWPGDRQVTHWLTLGSALGVVLSIVVGWYFGAGMLLVLLIGDIICLLLGGYMALRQDAIPTAVASPRITLSLVLKTTLDEGMLAFFMLTADIPRGHIAQRDRMELDQLKELADHHDWGNHPEALYSTPPVPAPVDRERVIYEGKAFDWITFASEYEPPEGVPGAGRWCEQQANRDVYARVFCHSDKPRPWLMCIHGYQMGTPGLDLSLFDVQHLHHDLGLNLIMPILPLHGPRRAARISGGRFLDGPVADLFHAQAQSLWDLRRCLAWVRDSYTVDSIGVLGYSLGGYNAAVLAALEPDLACTIAGIPMTDIPATLWRHLPLAHLRYLEACGVEQQWVSDIMAPLSPLHLQPQVPHDRRFIVAATGDQLVPAEQPLALWQHWDKPAMQWYQGTHLSVRYERNVSSFVQQALRDSGLVGANASTPANDGMNPHRVSEAV